MCLQRGRPGFNPWVRKIPWRRAWQSTRVFLPGGSHGQRTLVGYSPWGHDWVTNTFTFTQLLKLLISLLKSLHIRGYGFRVWQKTWVSLLKSVLEKCEVSHQSYIHHMNIWVYECIELCVCVYIYIHTHTYRSEKAMAPHSSTFAWKIPWTEEPGGLQSMGSLESDTTEWLHFNFSLSCIGEGNGNPLQYSCLENPKERGAWQATVHGVTTEWLTVALSTIPFAFNYRKKE